MSAQVNTVFTGKDESLSRTLKNIEGSASRVDKVLGTLKGRIRTAFEFHVINRGIALFERGIHRVLGILPDLINRGEDWARTVDRIVDITGMSAAQASELAAVAENVGVNSDGLGRMMNALARSVATNADEFRAYGIRVKDANGHLLDGYTIFQNVRQRIAEMGPSLQAAKLSQMAFGRAALESADMLTLSNREWQRQIELARQSGLIMTEAGLAAAEEWERTQGRLQQAITGIGAQILQGVAPALIGLTNGVTRVINANMDSIVRFGAGLVNFLANLAADLLGVQIDTTTLIGNAYDDAAKKSEKLRQRVDDMSNANQRSAASSRANAAATDSARKQQQRLREELERAQRQLARERRATTFTGGMNGVELELWKQQKAASVKAAQERVADARKALSDHRATMGKMTGVTAAAARRMRLDLQKTFGGGGAKGTIIEGLEQTLKDSKTFALGISDAIKDAIFGEDKRVNITGGAYVDVRSGGLLDALGKVGTVLGTVAGHLGNLNTFLGGPGGLIVGLGALKLLIDRIPGLLPTLPTPPGPGGGGGPASLVPWLGVIWASKGLPGSVDDQKVIIQRVIEQAKAEWRKGLGGGRQSGGSFGGVLDSMPWLQPQPRPAPPQQNDLLNGIAAEYSLSGTGAAVMRSVSDYLKTIFNGQPSTPRGLGGGRQSGGGFGFTPDGNLINTVMPGFGISNPYAMAFDLSLRRYLGVSSPLAMGQQDLASVQAGVLGAAQASAELLAPIGAGQLPVLVQNQALPIFGDVAATIQNQSLSITGNVGALVQNTDLTIKGRVDSVVQNTVLKVNGEVLANMNSVTESYLQAIAVNTGFLRTDFVDKLSVTSDGLLVRITGGGGGSTALAGRVKTLERQMTGVEKSALLTASQRHDRMFAGKEKSRINTLRINGDGTLSENKANKSAVISKSAFSKFRDNWYEILLDGGNPRSHQARLRALEGSDDGRGGNATRTVRARADATADPAARRTSDNTERMVNILLRIEKNTRTGGGGGRTSSLRPAV